MVQPRDPDCAARLDVGNTYLLGELAEVLTEDFVMPAAIPRSRSG